jgi:uncharacterized membrane protein YhaH (DUF805 family)
MKWYLKCLKQYADFSGRARRKEYWMFYLFTIIFFIVAIVFDGLLGSPGVISCLYFLALLIPSFAVTVRRLHDINKSGWWILIDLIPYIGAFWLLILLVTDSDPYNNRYGEDPKCFIRGANKTILRYLKRIEKRKV